MSGQVVNASLSRAFFALVRRDLLLAFRRRTELLFPVIFLMVVVSLFPLGIGPDGLPVEGPELLARGFAGFMLGVLAQAAHIRLP